MEVGGEGSSGHQKQPSGGAVRISYVDSVANLSEEGIKTLAIVNRNRSNLDPWGKFRDTTSAVFDKSCPQFGWLSSGWLVEERRVPSDRLYRYYYDPIGRAFDRRYKVEDLCQGFDKNRVVIIIDDDE